MQVFKLYPLANTWGRSGLFFAFFCAAGLGEGDVENDRDLEINSSKKNGIMQFNFKIRSHRTGFKLDCIKPFRNNKRKELCASKALILKKTLTIKKNKHFILK